MIMIIMITVVMIIIAFSGEYYHDILWRTTGQLIEEPLLWKGDTNR